MSNKENFKLFISFFRIGLFTFGGGYSMLPMIQKEIVDKHAWATDDEVMDYYAIGQSAPGIIAVNTATFIGYKNGGIKGAAAATLGVILPSLIIITLLAALLGAYRENFIVQKALMGIRDAVVALIAAAVIRMMKQPVKSITGVLLVLAGLVLTAVLNVSPFLVIVGFIMTGVLVTLFKDIRRNRKAK
jgi:chromate transporter